MKKLIFVFLFFSSLFTENSASAQGPKNIFSNIFRVNAYLPKLSDSTLYVYYVNGIDTVVRQVKVSHDGRFNFSSKISEPAKVFLNTGKLGVDPWNGEYIGLISFWVEPGKTTKLLPPVDSKLTVVEGNQTQKEQNEFDKINYTAEKSQNDIKRRGEQAKKDGTFLTIKPSLDKLWDSTETLKRNQILDFIKHHSSSYVSLWAIRGYMFYFKWANRQDELANSFDLLSKKIKNSKTAIRTKQFLGLEGNMRLGAKAKDISSLDSTGMQISLSSLQGKYVLIDFWASWCLPCRQQIPALKAIHQKFSNRNFTILSVSLDDDKSKWIAALKQERMPWPNISDLNGFKGLSVKAYNIHAIPFNILVDPFGKIVATNLNSVELTHKLDLIIKNEKLNEAR